MAAKGLIAGENLGLYWIEMNSDLNQFFVFFLELVLVLINIIDA